MAGCWALCFHRDPGRGPESGLRRSTAASLRAKDGHGRCSSPRAAPRPTGRSTIASPRRTPLRPARWARSRTKSRTKRRAPVFHRPPISNPSTSRGRPHQLRRNRAVGDPSLYSHTSDHWEVEDGIGQGAVLSGFLFNLLINGRAAAIKRACNGASCDSGENSLRVKVLLYADDVVILCENAADLQCALDAAQAWARSWRFHFGIGPSKSAVMVFGNTGSRSRVPPCFLSDQVLPHVKSYPYLGIVFS